MFEGRKLLIATQHEKEKVIGPVFNKALNLSCVVPPEFDTDQFGTFTGEVKRTVHPREAAKLKCLKALERYGGELAVANEGSFGPHPDIPFVPADEEWLVFVDLKNDLIIDTHYISARTNFSSSKIFTEDDLINFATRAKFPSHALIMRKAENDVINIVKGINDWSLLKDSFFRFKETQNEVYLETDMRAMHNPTRMRIIEKATEGLVERIKSKCPGCNMRGFGITTSIPGLPCEWCRMPTRSILKFIYTCEHCKFAKEEFVKGKRFEDPKYCDHCNP